MNKTVIGIVVAVIIVVGGGWIYYSSHNAGSADTTVTLGSPSDNGQPSGNPQTNTAADTTGSAMGTTQTSTDSTTTTTTTAPSSVPTGSTGATSTSKVDEFTVSGENFSFTPNVLTAKKGDTVKITFKNVDGFHDFHIDEFNVATPKISGGQQATVQFVADKTGSFQYYCAVGSHRAMGMWGTLTVQ